MRQGGATLFTPPWADVWYTSPSDMKDPNWNLPPKKHQLDAYLAQRDKPFWGTWYDQGTGKTSLATAQAAHQCRTGRCDALLILAPPGVEANWVFDELPKWWPADIAHEICWWTSKRSTTKKFMAAFDEFRKFDGVQILCMPYNALMTDRGAKAVRKFLDEREVFYIADESTVIKSPSAKTTKRVLASAKHAKSRRALNGTPVEDSPFDMYSQVKFVDPTVWEQHGISTFTQFKAMFGIFEQVQLGNGKSFPQLRSYRNLDLLKRCLYERGDRVLKEDCLDLPPKTYSKVYFELSPRARKIYNDLRDNYTTVLESGDVIDAELAIVRMTRFQQIASGYFPKGEDDDDLEPIDDTNPRLSALATALDGVTGQCIIFAKYIKDIEAIEDLLAKRGLTFGTYVGATDEDERERIKRDFQAGKLDVFLANKAAAKGLTLTAAETVVFYSNLFSADLRKQMEDRAHRIGQNKHVRYIDILARDTVDQHILAVLRRKKTLSATVTGDQLASWL